MERALARHDDLLRQAIDAYGGHVVKTVGDGFQAVFTTAPAALDAALAAEPWGRPTRSRCAWRDGDYFGAPLNRIARLFAPLPYAAVQLPPFPLWLLLGYCGIVVGAWLWNSISQRNDLWLGI